MAIFAKFRKKLRIKNFEAHFHRKLGTLEKCSNVKKLRTAEPQPIFTGSSKKKKCTLKTLSTHHGIFISSKNDHSFPIPYHEREVMLFTNSWLHRKTGRNQRNEPAAMFTCSME